MNLHAQASTPSSWLCSAFSFPVAAHFLYQAPPGAQQLTLPDFLNVAHFGHVILLAIIEVTVGVLTDVIVIGVCTTSSRSGNGRRVTCWPVVLVVAGVEVEVDIFCDIDPCEPSNMHAYM